MNKVIPVSLRQRLPRILRLSRGLKSLGPAEMHRRADLPDPLSMFTFYNLKIPNLRQGNTY